VHLNPKVVAIGGGYHGCHGVLQIYQKLTSCKIVDLHNESTWSTLGTNDLVHMETPLNPYGTALNISYFAEKAHSLGALLSVDSTFAPPPLQNPFAQGADYIMHSGTKYFGGHSDMLCGTLSISKSLPDYQKRYWQLFNERLFLGASLGSLEGWLGVRSLRTLELRVLRQSQNASELVAYLDGLLDRAPETDGTPSQKTEAKIVQSTISKVVHASLQRSDENPWLRAQMPGGWGPVFAVEMKTSQMARRLPSKLALFHHATSLGGVESLIEWRRMSDDTVGETLLRVSVGVENIEDLKADFMGALKGLME